jgi:signal transduction histidine kinase
MSENEELKSLREKNEELNRLYSAKTDEVSVSAHQIRTSLSGLKWIIKMFMDGDLGKLTAEQENLMKKGYENTDRAISIVSELLLINKTENITKKKYVFSEVDLEELIDSSIFDFSGEALAHGIEIIFLKPEIGISRVCADKEKFRIILQNLLENAIKYSNQHGKIFLTIKERGDFVEFSIKNTGPGISEEGKKRIFEKFYRDPNAQKKEVLGSGMGLFIAKKIVEDHSGKIWFESSADGGTTFSFTVPIFKKD